MPVPLPDHDRRSSTCAWVARVAVAVTVVTLLVRVTTGAGMAFGVGTPGSQPVENVNLAGLVVTFGDGEVAYAIVPFTESSISGFELLDRSGLALLSIEFGGLGQGVCAIEETGCDPTACRVRVCQTGDPDSAFWQYAQQRGDGSWSPSPLGASNSEVIDGGIDAWSWSSDPADPGAITLDDIADRTGVDLAAFRSGERADPALVILGENPEDPARIRQGIITAALIGGVAVIAGMAVFRHRRGTAT
jgi:hypothetical protein